MKKILFATALAAALTAASASSFATDVGVSLNFAQPGLYGRVDIGAVPGPQVVYTRPTVIYGPPVGVVREPMYLYVPVAHQRNWRRYCSQYGACGQPVYFVQERWYRNVYVPRYREHWHGPEGHGGPGWHGGPPPGRGWDRDRDHGREHGRDYDREHDDRRGHDDHRGRDH